MRGRNCGAAALTVLLSTLVEASATMSCRGSPIAALVAALGVVSADDASHGTRWLHTTKSDAYHDNVHRQLDAAQYGVHHLLLQNFSRTLEAANCRRNSSTHAHFRTS